jgi:hypothetical protein
MATIQQTIADLRTAEINLIGSITQTKGTMA